MAWQELDTTLPRSLKSVGQCGYNILDSIQGDTYLHRQQTFAIAQRYRSSRADDNKPIVGHRLLFLHCEYFLSPDPFYLHPNKLLVEFYLMPNDNINNYFRLFGQLERVRQLI